MRQTAFYLYKIKYIDEISLNQIDCQRQNFDQIMKNLLYKKRKKMLEDVTNKSK